MIPNACFSKGETWMDFVGDFLRLDGIWILSCTETVDMDFFKVKFGMNEFDVSPISLVMRFLLKLKRRKVQPMILGIVGDMLPLKQYA